MCLKYGEIKVNKKEFNKLDQQIHLKQVEISKIVISEEFKSDDDVKNFIGHKNGETVKPLCIILPQISAFIKSFKNTKRHVIFS